MISIMAMPGTDKALFKIAILERLTETAIAAAWQDAGAVVTKRLVHILTTGPRTGRVYTIRGKKHQASAPGEAPARRTGRLAKSVGYKVTGFDELVVGEEAPYASFLENGTGRMKPRPHLSLAVDQTKTDVLKMLERYIMEAHR
jgi:HK97 gp10 family phage protein